MTATVIQGECLKILQTLPDASVDCVCTDPPYSSGGFSLSERSKSTTEKYVQSGQAKTYPDFAGDSRDSRSYMTWCTLWISECVRLLKPGGYFYSFTDWRQLPTLSDAIQCGGITWRGTIAWNKGNQSRAPHKGYHRHACEFIPWGTKGQIAIATHDGPYAGCIDVPVLPAEKFHLTGKPVKLMREILRSVVPNGTVLDPFAGSGSTGVAAVQAGLNVILIEREAAYVQIARDRLAAAQGKPIASQDGLFQPEAEAA